MTVVVTGATGFIGRRLCRRLREDGLRVVAIGRRSKPAPPVEAWLDHDLSQAGPPELPNDTECVFHLAFAHSADGPSHDLMHQVNVGGTRAMLEAATCAGASRFVFASTGGVYGYRKGPAAEDDALAPGDAYAQSKVEAEHIVAEFQDEIAGSVLRLFFPYGRGQRRRLMPSLTTQVLRDEVIAVHPGGHPLINPIHVDDVAESFVRAMASNGPKVVNVAGREVIGIPELATQIGHIAGRQVRLADTLEPVLDMVADTTRMKSWMGNRPMRGLDDGLRDLVHELRAAGDV